MKLWELSATRLSSLLARGETSAAEVARAHLERIDAVDGRIHAFTEVLREQTLAEAEASDGRRRRGEARGPLEGLPVTCKECFDVAGRATTLGARIDAVSAADVQRVARQWLHPESMRIVVTGDRSKIERDLAPYGAIETRDAFGEVVK